MKEGMHLPNAVLMVTAALLASHARQHAPDALHRVCIRR
jgi:hypothetical protein